VSQFARLKEVEREQDRLCIFAGVSGPHMERFWDARAREDALFFVDSRMAYSAPDEEQFWRGGEEAVERLLGVLGVELPPDSMVVDIGCGVGRLTRPLSRAAAQVKAIDVSSEMLAEAQRLNGELDNVEWLHGDGQSLQPIADAGVDACISHVVFRHIPDPAITLGYIREMGRVLRPGGFAAFELSNDRKWREGARRRGVRDRLAAAVGRAPRGVTDDAWLGSHVEIDDVRRVAAESGMTLERIVGEGTEFCAILLRRGTGG
jgi:SAM-dependent methyltransferase